MEKKEELKTTIEIEVDTEQLDNAIEKANRLVCLLKEAEQMVKELKESKGNEIDTVVTIIQEMMKGRNEKQELFVRIPLGNIKMQDPYEQIKFDKMKSDSQSKVISYLEKILNVTTVTISINQ
ncbi:MULTISPECIES: hypothetical protein [Eisenbergiella]|uniref:Uncharacterized protein n=1 Tax=Eisenbergiella tayi TaxID=1432052 RepID=A0A1E3A3N2_9FIRM|nr:MULTISPECIES: hypothetical protein [Eisenbergiella]ODM03229.1 hypothetical protein BEI61_04023 [Eisenbergiella tayi]